MSQIYDNLSRLASQRKNSYKMGNPATWQKRKLQPIVSIYANKNNLEALGVLKKTILNVQKQEC